ncbi:MAG TPA: hypothetical protein VM487_01515 [Phycisphaerae bacterium]|nr:hypothetical protein [Phycisphaerae bacterium]
MFVIKHIRNDGCRSVYNCHNYTVSHDMQGAAVIGPACMFIHLTDGGGCSITPDFGETIYVENMAGKTIDKLESSRTAPLEPVCGPAYKETDE